MSIQNVLTDANWDDFCEFFNYCIGKGGSIDKDKHYIRIKLNRAPATLYDMISVAENWVLCEASDSGYHKVITLSSEGVFCSCRAVVIVTTGRVYSEGSTLNYSVEMSYAITHITS